MKVRNLTTGLEHEVPRGHFSLEDAEYETVPEPESEPEPEPKPKPKGKPKGR
jgi:hypothetical protein